MLKKWSNTRIHWNKSIFTLSTLEEGVLEEAKLDIPPKRQRFWRPVICKKLDSPFIQSSMATVGFFLVEKFAICSCCAWNEAHWNAGETIYTCCVQLTLLTLFISNLFVTLDDGILQMACIFESQGTFPTFYPIWTTCCHTSSVSRASHRCERDWSLSGKVVKENL